jgi:hypothetical protein
MLWFWIILGCAVVASLVVLEIRAERKPTKHRHPGQHGDYSDPHTGGVGGDYMGYGGGGAG